MVHALKIVHDFLKPGGILIDIHPSGQPPPIVVRQGDLASAAGLLQETDDFIEYIQAEAALAQAVENGWFELERRQEFHFDIISSSLVEFQEFLSENWKDAVIPVETGARIDQLMGAAPGEGKSLVASELVYITRYHLTEKGPL